MSLPTTLPWQTVTVFISSTFNDMHAERDYLVKRVFPELREWCEQRKLRLVDIDLRWGVTEADATNKNAVKVCLKRIDESRPFFLCFLGQRRGWVPKKDDIAKDTCDEFEYLRKYVGKNSVTELEIEHAVIAPMNDRERSEDSFFFLLEDTYLEQLPAKPAYIRNTFTNDWIKDPAERKEASRELKFWREKKIPAIGRPVHQYSAEWDPNQRSPELALPLQCPSSLPENQERWRKQWREVGIEPRSLDLADDPDLEQQARAFNERATAGRLTNFRSGDQDLAAVIIHELQAAIVRRYPDREAIPNLTPLQKEIDQQEQFLELNSTGFIERTGDFDALNQYVDSDSQDLFVLTAPAGMGKTMLLANWIEQFQERHGKERPVFYRFIGASDGSTTVDSVLRSLLAQIAEAGYLSDEIPVDPQELRNQLGKLLVAIGLKAIEQNRSVTVVIDALNQLESGLADTTWIPRNLPAGLKLVVSFKREPGAADELAARFRAEVPDTCAEVVPFDSLEDRRKLVDVYLDQYLKQLDHVHVEAVITSPGAENPLFLKVVLSELRVFGSFGNLGQKIRNDFGTTPKSAFDAVLRRLETDPVYAATPLDTAVPLLFGLLSHARVGLSEQELVSLFEREIAGPAETARQDTVRLLLRQVRPFLAIRGGRFDFFYDSFRLAAVARYEGDDLHQSQRSSQDWHRSLAAYFEAFPAWISQDEMKPTLRRAAELPHHLVWAGMADHLAELLLENDLLETVVYGLGPYETIQDIEYAHSPPAFPYKDLSQESMTALTILQGALRLSTHVLASHPEGLPSQLHGRLLESGQPLIERMLEGLRARTRRPWLRPVTASLTAPGCPLVRTLALADHTVTVNTVAITPDGRTIVSADGTVNIWDLRSGRYRHTLTSPDHFAMGAVINPDGCTIVSWDNLLFQTVMVRDLETGRERHTLTGHTGWVETLAVTPDGQSIVTGSRNGTVKVWDLASGREIRTLAGHTGAVTAVAVTPDGKSIVSGSHDETVKVWDLETGRELHTLSGHTRSVLAVAITPNGTTIVSGSKDNTVKVWDLNTGRERHTLTGHTGRVTSVALTPDGKAIVSGSEDGILKVWDLASGQELRSLPGHTNSVSAIAVTPDGQSIVSGNGDGTVKVWDLAVEWPINSPGHTGLVRAVAITPDGRTIVSGSEDHTVRVWNLESGREHQSLLGHIDSVTAVAITPDGRTIVSGSDDETLKVWDLGTGKERHTLADENGIKLVAVTPDGTTIVSVSTHGAMRVWNLETGREMRTLDGHTSFIDALAVNPDACTIVSVERRGIVKVWDLASGQELQTIHTHIYNSWPATVTPDGRAVVSVDNVSEDKIGTLEVWDLKTGKKWHTLAGDSCKVYAVAITSHGCTLVSGDLRGIMKVWDLTSGNQVAQFSADTGIGACAISDLQNTILAGDAGGAVHILRLENVPCGPSIVTGKRASAGGAVSIACPYCGASSTVRTTTSEPW